MFSTHVNSQLWHLFTSALLPKVSLGPATCESKKGAKQVQGPQLTGHPSLQKLWHLWSEGHLCSDEILGMQTDADDKKKSRGYLEIVKFVNDWRPVDDCMIDCRWLLLSPWIRSEGSTSMTSTHCIGVLVYLWQPTPSSQLGSPDAKRRLATAACQGHKYSVDMRGWCCTMWFSDYWSKMGQNMSRYVHVQIVDVLDDLNFNDASTALAEIDLNQQSQSGISRSLAATEGHQAFHHFSLFAHMR